MAQRLRQQASGDRLRRALQLVRGSRRDDPAAARARAGSEIDDVVGAPNRVFVVLDDEQRIALGGETGERVEQDAVVARMQPDGRLVEDVAHALQVRAELRRQPDALRFAARQRRRRTVERQVAEADLFQERQPRVDFRQHVARDGVLATLQFQCGEHCAHAGDGLRGQRRDRRFAELHVARDLVEPLAFARRAYLARVRALAPPPLLAGLLLVETAQLQSRAEAFAAPAVLGIEGEQARIELCEAARAGRARAARGEDRGAGRSFPVLLDDVHDALAEVERSSERSAQLALGARRHGNRGDRQLDRVLVEA